MFERSQEDGEEAEELGGERMTTVIYVWDVIFWCFVIAVILASLIKLRQKLGGERREDGKN